MTISDPSNRETAPALSDDDIEAIQVQNMYAGTVGFARAVLKAQADREQMEIRADGKTVPVNRWEIGVRRIVALLWGNRHEFEIDEVVEAVRGLTPVRADQDNWDDEGLVRAVFASGADREQRPAALSEAMLSPGLKVIGFIKPEDEQDLRTCHRNIWIESAFDFDPVAERPKGLIPIYAPTSSCRIRPPTLAFSVFDESGRGADDRVNDYGYHCFEQGVWAAQSASGADREQRPAALSEAEPNKSDWYDGELRYDPITGRDRGAK